jgi:hypothetical protein
VQDDRELLSSSFRNLRFSLALPLFSLLLAAVCVGSFVPGMIRLNHELQQPPTSPDAPLDPATIREIARFEQTSHSSFPTPLRAAAYLNAPAMLVELPIDFFTTWPDSWHPPLPYPFDDIWFWRAITWPIYTLPLWWLAGRALDALRTPGRPFRNPRTRTVEAFLMGIIGAGSLVVGVGLFFTADQDATNQGLRWILAPGLLWFALGILPAIAAARKQRITTPQYELKPSDSRSDTSSM